MDATPQIDAIDVCFSCPARHSDLCSIMPGQEVERLYHASQKMHLDAGDTLMIEGDPNQHVFNVSNGCLMVYRLTPDGRRHVMQFVLGGDFFGFVDKDPYPFSVEAITPSDVCRFRRNQIDGLAEAYPPLEHRLRTIAMSVIATSLDQLYVLARKSAVERVAFFLLHMAERQEKRGAAHGIVDLPMTRQDIADFLGLTIETVSRTFSKLKSERVIRLLSVHQVEIPDFEKLQTIAEGE